ncbi:MAG: polysaccharide biosynthesis protein [Calditrichaeota bacterium]|nr:polysaccharide biosynthesis protein [Calditrichota bacterium]
MTFNWQSFLDRLQNRHVGPVMRNLILIGGDGVALTLAYFGSHFLRMSLSEWNLKLPVILSYYPLYLLGGFLVFVLTRMYRTLWRYASVDAVFYVAGVSMLAVGVPGVIHRLMGVKGFVWSFLVVEWLLLASMVGGVRLSIRWVRRFSRNENRDDQKRVLIYGAGDAGEMIARDILQSPAYNRKLIGFIDDAAFKQRKSIHGCPVLGGRDQVKLVVEKFEVDGIIVAMPSVAGEQIRELLKVLRSTLGRSVALSTLPALSEVIGGKVGLQHVRKFDVRDLLRRSPVELDVKPVRQLIGGRTVLVSGAGGSIGSEICRQVSQCHPDKVILVDLSEASLYTVHEELSATFPEMRFVPVVGDICQRRLLNMVFEQHRPRIVFHAAAYKHVPLMEHNPWSAIVNNVIGTRVLAAVSANFGIERFVMISTDKAVRPTSVMGATKRICEILVQLQPRPEGSVFCAVRFGNVMGSSGSVIPKFESQIRNGGPVTVTDKDTTRFFMLTSEAVQLVLQAAAFDRDNLIYILDMGQPVRISDLARDMIHLYGSESPRKVEIVYTGLRPGEKLHEELFHTAEFGRTQIEKIWMTNPPRVDPDKFLGRLDDLLENCLNLTRDQLYSGIASLVPDFDPSFDEFYIPSFETIEAQVMRATHREGSGEARLG